METAASSAENGAVRPAQLIGLLLWRGGWILVVVWLLVEAARWILRFVELPIQLEVGVGLILAGGVLVVLSLILERIQDARREGDLSA
ncbi:MAG: hypothetical protein ACYST0_11880 [Planctomycetota bacterium]|jgi:hypothetical protein